MSERCTATATIRGTHSARSHTASPIMGTSCRPKMDTSCSTPQSSTQASLATDATTSRSDPRAPPAQRSAAAMVMVPARPPGATVAADCGACARLRCAGQLPLLLLRPCARTRRDPCAAGPTLERRRLRVRPRPWSWSWPWFPRGRRERPTVAADCGACARLRCGCAAVPWVRGR